MKRLFKKTAFRKALGGGTDADSVRSVTGCDSAMKSLFTNNLGFHSMKIQDSAKRNLKCKLQFEFQILIFVLKVQRTTLEIIAI